MCRSKECTLLQDALETNYRRFLNFLGFAKAFFIRRNPFKAFADSVVSALKDALTIKKKLKMAQYRVNYHKHQLYKMESLIAENNDHAFLQGKNLDQKR